MKSFRLIDQAVRQRAIEAVREAPAGYQVKVGPASRSLDQNAAQWPILQAFADQLVWPVNGQMTRMSAEDWKDVLTAAFTRESRIAEGLQGGHVFLGMRTKDFNKQQFSDWLDFLNNVAAERGVKV